MPAAITSIAGELASAVDRVNALAGSSASGEGLAPVRGLVHHSSIRADGQEQLDSRALRQVRGLYLSGGSALAHMGRRADDSALRQGRGFNLQWGIPPSFKVPMSGQVDGRALHQVRGLYLSGSNPPAPSRADRGGRKWAVGLCVR